jgi:putative Mg2+ transporter-C (MgtC) family protein
MICFGCPDLPASGQEVWGRGEKLSLQGLATQDGDDGRTVVVADIFSPDRNGRALEEIVARVSIEPEVKAVSWQRAAA